MGPRQGLHCARDTDHRLRWAGAPGSTGSRPGGVPGWAGPHLEAEPRYWPNLAAKKVHKMQTEFTQLALVCPLHY